MCGGPHCRCSRGPASSWSLYWTGSSWVWHNSTAVPPPPKPESSSSSRDDDGYDEEDYSDDSERQRSRSRSPRNRGREEQDRHFPRHRSISPRRAGAVFPAAHQSRKSRYDEFLKPPHRTTTLKILRTETLAEQDASFRRQKKNPEFQQEWNKQHPPDSLIAYTDGSCIDQVSSGFGIYFGPGHELNRAVRIEGELHNSCLAEILAATRALELIHDWSGYRQEPVVVRTDFLPLVQAMSKGPKPSSIFAGEYQLLWSVAKKMPKGVEFQHVYGHGDDPGNQAADELARQAALSRDPERRAQSEITGSRVRDMTGHRGRSASRDNCREHIRSHSAFVGRRK